MNGEILYHGTPSAYLFIYLFALQISAFFSLLFFLLRDDIFALVRT